MQLLKMNLSLSLLVLLLFIEVSSSSSNVKIKKAYEFTANNITTNYDDWESDLAIMFYAPWCKYCKQLSPSWDQIANLLYKNNNDLKVGKFNCDAPSKNVDICAELGVDRYPSIFYIGYGNFNQAPNKGFIFGSNQTPRIVRYNADLYPEALYDWIRMLSFISWAQRSWDDFVGIFNGKSRSVSRSKKLQEQVNKLENKVEVFGQELEKYKADELFDKLSDNGDPFPILNKLEPDEFNLPLRVCVSDMALEYCKYHLEEKYCATLTKNQCGNQNLAPIACRPDKCPFEKNIGCKVVSACMQTDVIEQYKEALKK